MATIASAIETALNDNWAIGLTPVVINSEDELQPEINTEDYIYIMGYTLKEVIDPITFTESNITHTIQMLVNTADLTNKEVDLNTLVTEARRIIDTTGYITGFYSVKVTEVDRNVTMKEMHVYRALVTITLFESMVPSASAAGTAATADWNVTGDLTVGGDVTIAGVMNAMTR